MTAQEVQTMAQSMKQLVTGFATTVLLLGAIAPLTAAPIVLKEGETTSGFIRNTSPVLRFRNQAKTGAPLESAVGQDYTFNAQRGDSLEISVDVEDGSTLKPILVLINPQGRQVSFDSTLGLLKYRVPTAGKYTLMVLAQGKTRGRYTVNLVGLTAPTQVAEADQVMTNVLKLRIIGCGVPNVAVIKIGDAERCTRDIEPGQYLYNATTKRITLVDTRRELLAQRLQLTLLDQCPTPATSVVQILVQDPNDKKDYTYCATPNRYVSSGLYRYDIATDKLSPATVATTPATPTPATPTPATPTPATPPVTKEADPRRELLQKEYGLSVMESCPAARTRLVVVNFLEEGQVYTYCAQPNRLVTAGEYVYNRQSDRLEVARKTPDCTISIGGICVLK